MTNPSKNSRELPELLTVREVARVLRLSRSKVYELVAARDLPALRPGGRLRVTVIAVREYLKRSEL